MTITPFLIYKSSAGSGKTTALIGVFLRLILADSNPGHFRKVLAITFTNKATNEMKERLLAEMVKLSKLELPYKGGDFMIDELIAGTGISVEELQRRAAKSFESMLFEYGDLAISTIDTFNHKLIRAFSRELNLRSDFQVELDEYNLFREAVMRLLERVGSNEAVTTHLTAFIASQQDDEKRSDVMTKLVELRQLVMLEEATTPVEALGLIDAESFIRLSANLKVAVKQFEDSIQKLGEEAMKIIDGMGAGQDDFHQKGKSWFPFFQHCKALNIDGLTLTPTRMAILGETWWHKTAPSGIRAAIETATPELASFAEKAIQLLQNEMPKYLLRKAIMSNIHLIAILNELGATLEEIKQERNILPIAYFNRVVSKALVNEPVAFIYENLGARFDHILVDEFQDTSTMQWINLLPLFEESISRGKTSLVVGDAKQSIYRWRGGKAEQLIALPEINDPDGLTHPELKNTLRMSHQIIPLNTNYRSAGRVIDFNNSIFGALSPALTSDGSLYRSEYDAVAQHIPLRKQGKGYVEVNCLGKGAELELQNEMVLHQIRDLLARGYEKSDLCILVRRRKDGNQLASFLIDHGIHISTSDSRYIDRDINVKLLIAMLRLYTRPADNPARISAMRALCTLNSMAYQPEVFTVDAHGAPFRSVDFFRFLKSINLPLPKAVWFESGAYQACETLIQNYCPPARSAPAVVALLNYILGKGGMRLGVEDFFRHWDASGDKPGAGDVEGSNGVQMLTIHKAKGLQFKVCIIPFLNWQRSNNRNVKWIDVREMDVEGLQYAPLNISKRLIEMGLGEAYHVENEAIDFDNLNMIYVALTRAVEELYINYTHTQSGHIGSHFHSAMEAVMAQYAGNADVNKGPLKASEPYGDMDLDDEAEQFSYGTKQASSLRAVASRSEADEMLKAAIPATVSWMQRFPFAYDPESMGRDISRKMGIYFHRLAAETASADEALAWITARLNDAEIAPQEQISLTNLSEALYSDAQYRAFSDGGTRLAERELIYNGEVLRPDLVFEMQEGTVVIDFKTGEEKPSHRNQLLQYAEALKAIGEVNVKAYLLYLDPLRWVEL